MKWISRFYIFAVSVVLGMLMLMLSRNLSSPWATCIIIGLIGNEIVARMDLALDAIEAVFKCYIAHQEDQTDKGE